MNQPPDYVPSETVTYGEAELGLGGESSASAGAEDSLDWVASPGRDIWRRFRQQKTAIISLAIVVALILLAVAAPFLHTVNPLAQDYTSLDAGPSAQHWFGTDGVGGDQYSRLLYGLRIPLAVGLIGTLFTVILGVIIGVVAGYYGGVVDSLLSRFTDLMFAFPGFLLALIVVSLFGGSLDSWFGWWGRVVILTIIFAVVSWPPLMRFVRALTLGLREQQFVEAARVAGSSNARIIQTHLLPNMWGLILVQASFIVVSVISIETVLSVFGLGVPPPHPDLGQMLYDGVQRLDASRWEVFFPSITLVVLILAFTFVGDGLRDAVDPRSRR